MMPRITKDEAIAGCVQTKIRYMRQQYAIHPQLADAIKQSTRLLTPGTGISITVVVGPTGVGKTTLARCMIEHSLRQFSTDIVDDPSCVPCAYVEVPPSEKEGGVDWSLFNRRCGIALHDALPEERLATEGTGFIGGDMPVYKPGLRAAFERAIVNRKLRHLVLDECGHFVDSAEDTKVYGNVLKSLANVGGINVLMLGAYGAEKIIESTAQLARRVNVVHFRRFDSFESYCIYLNTLAQALPLAEPPDLLQHAGILYEHCCQLGGLTADTIIQAVVEASLNEEKPGEWSDDYLWHALPQEAKRRTIMEDLLVGEEHMKPFEQWTAKPTRAETEEEIRERLKAAGKLRDEENHNPESE
jgi:energy-coupling factor transporter ATP-binding protein EcfA2